MESRTNQLQEMLEGFYTMRHRTNPKRLCQSHGFAVTHSQWMVLNFIHREKLVSVKQIRTTFGITSSAATQLVSGLLKKELVIKKTGASDRRKTLVCLSPVARKKIAGVQHTILTKLLGVFSVLNDKEFTTYVRLNRKIINNLK